MAKKHPTPKLHPQIENAGFIHENIICETYGYAWSTWERDYRTKIPGMTTPTGRWIHETQLVKWFTDNATTGSEVSK